MSNYQLSLDMPRLDERSAKLSGQPTFPATRRECAGGAPERRTGATVCPHLLCRYHLLGELARRPDSEAEAAMVARLEGAWTDSCALDVADELERNDRGMTEEECGVIYGVSRERIVQMTAEARSRLRAKLLPMFDDAEISVR